MWIVHILFGVVLPSLSSCASISTPHGSHRAADRGVGLVTGLVTRTVDGQVHIRREIRDLKENFPDQWNLYLLGLHSFQRTEQSNPLSYYEIAGIHGKPYKEWGHAQGIPGKKAGYCPHQSNLFFGWHRPYLAIYEQEVYRHVLDIAYQFPPELVDQYVRAADGFRIPYWDWALGEKGGNLPDFFTTPTIQVISTGGFAQTIPNPLHSYEFHPVIPDDFTDDRFTNFNTTMRWPTSTLPDAQSQNNIFKADFEAQRRNYLNKVNNAFMRAKTMNEFSQKYIEDVHGFIHWAIGGGGDHHWGHMWPAEFSAFEPLFMIHHCNVDRLFALWQGLHPDLYIEPAPAEKDGTVWFHQGDVLDADTPLMPFWSSSASFWTTNQVKDTAVLGYAYPETQRWNFDSDEAYRASVNATVAQLYSSSVRARLTAGVSKASALGNLLVDDTYVDWNVQIQGASSTLPATFIAKFFLVGDFSSDIATDVGAWTVLMSSDHHVQVEKNKRASMLRMDMKGMVSLTESLLDHIVLGKLASLDASDVVPYLKDKLTWKVQAGDGTIVPQSDLNGLIIEVISTNVRIPQDPNQLLVYSDETAVYPEVTLGKSGGARASD